MLNTQEISTGKPVKTLIVGCHGRMGRMLLGRAQAAGMPVDGVDRGLSSQQLAEACTNVELALLCVPAPAVGDVATALCPFLPATAILADITSVKEEPLRQMEGAWQGAVVGTHPLFGPTADTGMTEQKVVIVPGTRARAEHIARTEAFFSMLGCSSFRSSAREHDRAMAYIQNLNFISNLSYFALLAEKEELLPFLTPSFRRRLDSARKMLTEDAQLFSNLLQANTESEAAIQKYRAMLQLTISGHLEQLCERAQWWWQNESDKTTDRGHDHHAQEPHAHNPCAAENGIWPVKRSQHHGRYA